MKIAFFVALGFVLSITQTSSTASPPVEDVVFAKIGKTHLRLNILLPEKKETETKEKVPLIVYIHGGGWKAGSYKNCLVDWLPQHGFAVASVQYRLTHKAIFPAQLHDCKAAIRWLRAHADEYNFDAKRIGVTGTSAGGHLALMVGLTNGNKELEGTVGENLDQSSAVSAVVDYYGATNFIVRSSTQPHKTEKPGSVVFSLLGGAVSEKTDLAKLASPEFHISQDDPPILILHGDKDPVVPFNQSVIFEKAAKTAGLNVTLQAVPEAGHGGKAIFTKEYRQQVADFFKLHLKATN